MSGPNWWIYKNNSDPSSGLGSWGGEFAKFFDEGQAQHWGTFFNGNSKVVPGPGDRPNPRAGDLVLCQQSNPSNRRRFVGIAEVLRWTYDRQGVARLHLEPSRRFNPEVLIKTLADAEPALASMKWRKAGLVATLFYLDPHEAGVVLGALEKAGASVPASRKPYVPKGNRPAPKEAVPSSPDPDLVGRGFKAHDQVQDALAAHIRSVGLVPEEPPDGIPCDLLWTSGKGHFVAEVKSTTSANESHQLRLGLGQVLHYRALLRQQAPSIRVDAVLAAEREPDPIWVNLCQEVGVRLVWPPDFTGL